MIAHRGQPAGVSNQQLNQFALYGVDILHLVYHEMHSLFGNTLQACVIRTEPPDEFALRGAEIEETPAVEVSVIPSGRDAKRPRSRCAPDIRDQLSPLAPFCLGGSQFEWCLIGRQFAVKPV